MIELKRRLKELLEEDQSLMTKVSFEDMQPKEQPMDDKAMQIAYKSYINVIESLKATERAV